MKNGLLRKAIYFRDLALLAEIVRMQREIRRGGGERAIAILEATPVARGRSLSARRARKIDRYVDLGLRLAGAGTVNQCLPRSVIRAALMRRAGADARVAFGLNRDGERLDGHCWVVLPGDASHERMAAQFQSVQILPEGPHE